MNFLAPLSFLFAVLLPLVVLMYLLKLKRQRRVMPSTLLWRRAVEDLVANAPFQKLRNNLLLFLQLLILALLIVGLARPTMRLVNLKGRTLILLIDISASMSSLNKDRRPRIEHAREAALRLVDSLGGNDQAIVVTFSNKTQIVQTSTADREALRRAIRALQPLDTPTDLQEAALILTDLVTVVDSEGKRIPRPEAQVVLISDGAVGSSAELLVDFPNLEYITIGDSWNNVGLTELDIRQTFSGTFEYQVFANVLNAGENAEERFVELSLGGEVLDMKRVRLEPGETSSVVFTTGEPLSGIAQVAIQGTDDFPLDNLVRGIFAPKSALNVLLVTKSNYFLEQVLGVDSHLQVSRITPAEYKPRSDYDLTIFDNCSFPDLMSGNYLFINSVPREPGFKVADESLQRPAIIDFNRMHPLMRFVNLERILIYNALRITEYPDTALVLAESELAPMLLLYEKEPIRMLVIPFDLKNSDWPLQVSFPIFMSNILDYFTRSLQTTARAAYRSGDIVPIYADRVSSKVAVQRPDDQETVFPLEAASTVYFTQTERVGIYQLLYEKANESKPFCVNLLSESESNIAPVATLQIGGRKIEGQSEVLRTNQEVWLWFVALGLAFLIVEWLIYCRRAWV